MGKINGCLKCIFIFFNSLFAIIGSLLIFAAVKATGMSLRVSSFGGPGLGWFWVFAISILSISCLGIYAASKEHMLILKIFAGFMVAGFIIMMIFGIILVVGKNKMRHILLEATPEETEAYMKEEVVVTMLDSLQETAHCCGLVSARDWGSNIPSSCHCDSYSYSCTSKPQFSAGPKSVYEQGCGQTIYSFVEMPLKVMTGIVFGFASTALLGLLLSFLMIRQLKRHDAFGETPMTMKGY
ncbi:23 kDa integral membrane protein-like [Echeneis naucrates]|uniref:Tetraspanin n=1 Tax=Echeneis naucrates TaxID=173247 RepID=A0A665UBN7_ECHNA|nr:23 kDa integral membrane protein-like [Echeneis naucrates]